MYVLTAFSSMSDWAFFWAASIVIVGVEPKSLRNMKDMEVVAGLVMFSRNDGMMRGKWAPFYGPCETLLVAEGAMRDRMAGAKVFVNRN